MFELAGVPDEAAIHALKQASYKFSIKTKVVGRPDQVVGEQE
jgi:large subunit ribosomal protein L16